MRVKAYEVNEQGGNPTYEMNEQDRYPVFAKDWTSGEWTVYTPLPTR
jgi:hypothetical protein